MITGAQQTSTQATPDSEDGQGTPAATPYAAPSISAPRGGGAIRGIDEKFAVNPATGTGSMTVRVPTSPGRSGFGPELSLSYDSGAGNGVFGYGWSLSLPNVTRKTDKGLPLYWDDEESDVFVLSGAEDLVPVLGPPEPDRTVGTRTYRIQRYRPRVEGLFGRIERWTDTDSGEIHWRSITRDNVTSVFGNRDDSRIAEPGSANPLRIFSWLISESYDDKGNAILYTYKPEDEVDVDHTRANERNRSRTANRHLKSIRYGNRLSRREQPDLSQHDEWMFEVVLDYGEHDDADPKPGDSGDWLCRNDPFSAYRAGWEVRTQRLCQRMLLFHHFPEEPDVGADCLVRSLDFAYKSSRGVADDVRRGNPVASCIASITQTGYRRKPARRRDTSQPHCRHSSTSTPRRSSTTPFATSTRRASRTCPEESTALRTSGSTWMARESPASSPSKPTRGSTSRASARAASARSKPLQRDRPPHCSASPGASCSTWPAMGSSISSSSAGRRPVSSSGQAMATGAPSRPSNRCRISTGKTRTCVLST